MMHPFHGVPRGQNNVRTTDVNRSAYDELECVLVLSS